MISGTVPMASASSATHIMKWKERYRRLSFWNRIAFWGSVCSIVAIPAAVIPLLLPSDRGIPRTEPQPTPVIVLKFEGTDILVGNEGTCEAKDLELHSVFYTFDSSLKINNRRMVGVPAFTCPKLAAGASIVVPKTNYLDKSAIRAIWKPDKSTPNPLMLVVLSFRRQEGIKRMYRLEPYLVITEDWIVPFSQIGPRTPEGNMSFYLPIIKAMKEYETTFSIPE